eukprot:gene16374-19372_t
MSENKFVNEHTVVDGVPVDACTDSALLVPPSGNGVPANDAGGEFRPVRQRWWILFVVSAICATQGGMWSNFGPISAAVEPLLGWSDGTIALLANWGPICYLLAFLPFAWLLNERGLRGSALRSA